MAERRWHESFFVKVPGTTPFVNGKGVTEYADRFVLAIPKCASAALTSYHDPEYLDTRRKEYLDGGGRTKGRLYHHDEVVASGLPVDAYLRPWRERLASTLVRLAHASRTDTLDSAFDPARMIRQMVEPALVAGPESLSVFLRPQWFYLDGVPGVTLHRMSDLEGQIPVIDHGRPALDWRDIPYDLDRLLPIYGPDEALLNDLSTPPLVVEEFDYATVIDLLTSRKWNVVEAKEPQAITLDTAVGYGTSDRSMRYDWPNPSSTDYTIRPGFLTIPGDQTHVWIEYVVRFAPTFGVDFGGRQGPELKLATAYHYGAEPGRDNIPQMQEGRFVVGWPNDVVPAPGVSPRDDLWDGQPHVFRVEIKRGSGDGILRFWVDGKLLFEKVDVSTHANHTKVTAFGMGNMNQSVNRDGITLWWHRIAVYNQNPGWT